MTLTDLSAAVIYHSNDGMQLGVKYEKRRSDKNSMINAVIVFLLYTRISHTECKNMSVMSVCTQCNKL